MNWPAREGREPDDRGEDFAEFRGDQQQPLLVELGGCDLEQGHDLA
ncbi:hypothetical protein [Streptomyces sp. ADI96-02]|nr:hypothetical protein [Streptomyces sp. ADI96-02]